MQCSRSKNLMNDEIVLTVAMVIHKVEPSAKKAAAWTHEEFTSAVVARS